MKHISSIILCILLSTNVTAMDHSFHKTKSINLDTLIKKALKRNSNLKSEKHKTMAKKAKISQAGAYKDPYLSYSFSNYPVNSLKSDQYNMTGREISLQQNFSFPGKLTKKENSAKYQYESQKNLYSDKEQELIYQVKEAYFELYFVHKELKITKENILSLRQFNKLVKTKYKTGKANQSQSIKVNLRLTALKLKLITLNKKRSIKEADLNVLIDNEAHNDLGYPSMELPSKSFNFKQFTMHFLYKNALKYNSRYASYKSLIKSAKEDLSYASYDYLPEITLGAKYRNRQATKSDPSGEDFVTATIGLTLPLYFLSKQSEQKKEAKYKKLAAIAKKRSSEKVLSHHIHHILLSVKENYDYLRIYKNEILPQSEQALKSSRTGYKVGSVNFLSLMDTEKQHFSNRVSYEKTLTEYNKAIALLERNIGVSMDKWK